MKRDRKLVAAAAAATLILAGCGSSTKHTAGGATSATQPAGSSGQTSGQKSPFKIGVLTSLTGPQGSDYSNSLKGLDARVKLQNANGGVDGRQIDLDVKDDSSTTAGNLTGAQLLITQGSLLIVEASQSDAASARYLHESGIPVLGENNTNTFGTEPFTNMFGTTGSHNPKYPAITTWGKFLASKGVKGLATVGYGAAPTSTDAALAFAASARAAGLKSPYVNTSLPLTGANFTAIALGIKSSGADAVYGGMGSNANLSLAEAVRQVGANVKVFLFPTGGSQTLLDSSANNAAMQGVYYFDNFVPAQLQTPATKTMQQALQQYEQITTPADYYLEEGYMEGSLLVEALTVGGSNPTRQAIITNLRKVTGYTADGLETQPVDYNSGDTAFGVGPNDGSGAGECVYFIQAQGHAFVPLDTSPECGTIIPGTGH